MKLRIPRDELKVGMFIERAVLEVEGKSKTKVDFINNILIDSQEKLKELKSKNIKYLIIDTAKELKEEPQQAPHPQPEPIVEEFVEPELPKEELLESFEEKEKDKTKARALVPFEEELHIAREVKTEAVKNVKKMLQDAAVGKSFDTEPARQQVNDMVKSIFRNKDALISLTRLKSFDEYTFMHSVNVTVLSIALARELKFPKEQIDLIGLGGMLHDIGKVKVPEKILNKPGKLTPEERLEIQKHTTFGYNLLKVRQDIPEISMLIAYEHHERADGTGYPCGKKLSELQQGSLISNVTDVYDALTSARVYKPGMPPPYALSFIKARAETEFCSEYVDKFIEVIGIFPVGSVVEFNTGQVGIVKEINRDNLFEPSVLVVMNAQRQRLGAGRLIDPSKYPGGGLKIIRYHDPADLGIIVSEYLDLSESRI